METNASQSAILQRLKHRGPQSVKILAQQLAITTMGVRQHLAGLEQQGLIRQTAEARQNRGRPVHYWILTGKGHRHFPNRHPALNVELIDAIDRTLGAEQLHALVDSCGEDQIQRYSEQLRKHEQDTNTQLQVLAALRSDDGFLAEVRLLPDGWLFIENHCPLYEAAQRCAQFCKSELSMFQKLLGPNTSVSQTDHALSGSRRCAFKIVASQ